MESDVPLAPPVVAVVVVHRPGPWFEETLGSLADQDYPNLNTLFLLTGGSTDAAGDDLQARIVRRLPDAFVRDLEANPGFGAAADDVLRLVEGDSGFFCFCHDDIALEPDAVRALVEELYRSNAGVVGPKLVTWSEPSVLQHVGLGLDRFGEVDPVTEPGEYDQEQHDAVRDVFVIPSACLLVRADLFRALGGFDPSITFHGDDVDLCWRVHLSGAHVVVAPQARVRHREELEVRRPDLNHNLLRARHRMRSVATLTSTGRLPMRSLELALLTVAELVIGLFTGRLGEAWASTRAFVGLLARSPALIARRGSIAKTRHVADSEILELQNRGSARLTSYRRARDTETYIGADANVRRWRESSLGATIAWVVVVIGIIAASRTMIDTAVPVIGEFRPLPDSPRQWWSDFVTGWNPGGLGASVANPTGWAVVSIASVLWLFRMGLGLTVLVVGSVFVGVWGTWRLATLYPSNRARISALLVYAAVPLVPGVISTGRLSALFAYAAIPWFVQLLRVAVGIGTADPAAAIGDLRDGVIGLARRERIRRTASLALVTAVAVALVPAVLPVVVVITIVLGLTSALTGAGLRIAAWFTALGLTASALAWLLNVPWSPTWSWNDLAAPPLAGATGRGAVDVASMAIGQGRVEVLALALYVPVVVALAVGRAWRLTWAARAGGLIVVFLGLAVLQDRDALSIAVPDVGILLVPVALGLALSAASAVAAFGEDVAGRTFGWRQPVGLLSIGAVAVGLFPALLTVADGAWFAPRTSLVASVEASLAPPADVGDYRVLYIGDPRLIPFPSDDLGGGVAMALVDDGATDLRDRWPVADRAADGALRDVLAEIAESRTLRGGRLLAPFGVRYVIVPFIDGAGSPASQPLPVPAGLLDALDGQLDLVRSISPPDFARYENGAVIPTTALLPGPLAGASSTDDIDALVAVDTAGATPMFAGADEARRATADVAGAGVVSLATPVDDAWRLAVGGVDVAARPAFGVTTAYDVAGPGPAELGYVQPTARTVTLVLQGVLWLLVLGAASHIAVPSRLRPRRMRDETLIDLDAEPGVGLPIPGDDVILRRLPMLTVSLAAFGVIGLADPEATTPVPAHFASIAATWMPAVPPGGALTSTWFCPGVPAGGEEGTAGQVIIANSGPTPMQARVTLLAGPGQAVVQAVTVPPFERSIVDAVAAVTTPYASAVVEIDGGGGLVEQRATQPSGTSVAPCANQPSTEWYLAEGFTAANSNEQLVLTNPYDGWASVDIGFATSAGSRQPLEGEPVPPRSVKIIDMDSIAARDEAEVAVTVEVTRGRLVVGRAQVYDGDGRLGYSMTLASPALRSQWWFANGAKGPGVIERFSIYNPTEEGVEVVPLFLGTQGTDVVTEPIRVPARQVVTYDAGTVQGLPDGRHAVVFDTSDDSQSIVVERAVTRTIDGIPTTSVLPGAVSRPEDAFVADTWTLAVGPAEPTEDALVVYNTTGADATVTVQVVTAEGLVTVPSLAEVALPAGGLITVSLTDPAVLDSQLVVRSTSPVFIERSLPREPAAQGRSTSWAVPVVG